MAIAVPSISAVSEAGHRGIDIRDDFVTKQEAFQDDVTGTFVPEINATITNMNVLVDDVNILVPVAPEMAILGTVDVVADLADVGPVATEVGAVGTDILKGIGTNQPTDSSVLNALTNATDAAASATSASTSEDNAQLYQWIAEAWKLTAQSFAEEAEDVFTNIVTSDGDGTFTYTPTIDYSAKHYKLKAEAYAASINPIDLVHISGVETVTGTKTFSVAPVQPNGDSVADGDYASTDGTIGGTVKMKVVGDTLYLTQDGSNA